MEADIARPLPVPKPRPFPITGVAPGPRCGQTLTAIAGPDGDLSKARLVLFGKLFVISRCMNRIKLPILAQVVPPHWRDHLGRGMHQLRLDLLLLVGFRAKKPQRSSTP